MGFKLGVVVCVDDPTAHQLTSGSNMGSHANTHTSFRPHIRPSTQRYVCVCACVWVTGSREREERVNERDIGAGRGEVRCVRKDTKEKCACERVCIKKCFVQSIKDIERAVHQMTCSPKTNKVATVLSCRNLFWICLCFSQKDSALKTS